MKQAAKECLRHASNRLLFAAVAVCMLTVSPCTFAAFDLSWRPQLRLGTRATDNLRTAINDAEAAWGFDTGGGVQFDVQSDALRSRITPAFNFRRFVIGEGADADEYEVRTSTQWAFLDRASASLDFDYIRDSTLSTELTDTGRQTAVANRDTINVAPNIGFLVTERTSVNIGFLYSDVEFEELVGTPFTNYDFKQVNVNVSHAVSHRLSVFANSYVSEFRTPSRGGKSLTYGGMGGMNYRHSDTLDGDFGVGYVQSEIDFQRQEFSRFQVAVDPNSGQLVLVPIFVVVDDSATENGPIAQANIRKRWSANIDSEIAYSRSVSPTVFGAQSATDDINIYVDYKFTDRLTTRLRGGYNMRSAESDTATSSNANLDRNRLLLGGSLRYRISPTMSIAANYRFLYNDLASIDESSFANSLFITFTYNGEPHYYRGY